AGRGGGVGLGAVHVAAAGAGAVVAADHAVVVGANLVGVGPAVGRAQEGGDDRVAGQALRRVVADRAVGAGVDLPPGGFVHEYPALVCGFLLDVRLDQLRPGVGVPVVELAAIGELLVGVVVVVAGQRQLLQVVGALGTGRRLAHLLHGGDQQADKDGNDGNHDQQLD